MVVREKLFVHLFVLSTMLFGDNKRGCKRFSCFIVLTFSNYLSLLILNDIICSCIQMQNVLFILFDWAATATTVCFSNLTDLSLQLSNQWAMQPKSGSAQLAKPYSRQCILFNFHPIHTCLNLFLLWLIYWVIFLNSNLDQFFFYAIIIYCVICRAGLGCGHRSVLSQERLHRCQITAPGLKKYEN